MEEDAVWLFLSNYTARVLIKPYVKGVGDVTARHQSHSLRADVDRAQHPLIPCPADQNPGLRPVRTINTSPGEATSGTLSPVRTRTRRCGNVRSAQACTE